jgi:hypothetical protein
VPSTSKYLLRYPSLSEAPNGPQAFQNLANDTETAAAKLPQGLLHSYAFPANSASIGTITWGLSNPVPVANRRVRLTATGGMSPPSQGVGMLLQFMRAINGAAGVAVGPKFYHVAPNPFEEGFTFSMIDIPPAGSVVYYIQCQGHYANGSVLSTGTAFYIEDAGSAV